MATKQEIEAKAQELYEEARQWVQGRPPWRELNEWDTYDRGMQEKARQQARELLESAERLAPLAHNR
jgi:vacuolar-type H+-ATPase subunit H